MSGNMRWGVTYGSFWTILAAEFRMFYKNLSELSYPRYPLDRTHRQLTRQGIFQVT
jgi:hypothetical protein